MKKICIVGLGISGLSILDYFADKNAKIIAFDSNENIDKSKFEKYDKFENIDINIGKNPTGTEDVDIIYVSPGISLYTDYLVKFKNRNVPITGEVELAYEILKDAKYIGITGTNGKTTTTSMLGEIYKSYESNTYVAGNIGISLLNFTKTAKENSIFITELSSFQLESIIDFKPHIAVILNITPDHIERHKTMQEYKNAKFNITKNQTSEDFLVLNKDDSEIDLDLSKVKAQVVYFSQKEKIQNGVYYDSCQRAIINNLYGKNELVIKREDIHLLGNHNIENTLASVTVALLDGIPTELIKKSIAEFKSVKHRMQEIRTLNGVKYINDSKGTNVMSTVKALEAINSDIILIAGGYDKNVEFDELIKHFDNKVKKLVLFGTTKYQILDTAIKYGFKDIIVLENLSQAVKICNILAKEGDYVLLSPACASWDMYKSYEHRGDDFISLVNELKE